MSKHGTNFKAPRTSQRGREKPGRPSLYRVEFSELVFEFALSGLTDEEIAERLRISASTLHLWKRKHPEFSESIRRGKNHADGSVARSLYHRATGYWHPAVKIFNHEGKPLVVEYVEHYPPETKACIQWLRNRRPNEWGKVHRIESARPSDVVAVQQRSVERLRTELMQMGRIGRQAQASPDHARPTFPCAA